MEQVVAYGETQGEPIKLFVGQIPKTWMEGEVRQILEPFGTIQELTVLKDRASGLHKGCAFVTYTTRKAAIDAQKVLHEKKTLPGMNHPMQVKPATNEPKSSPVEERRLFVGMLSKTLTEEDVRALFSPYGIVEDVSILRNADGKSKGAAFVRMSSRVQALQAITALHHSQTMPSCSAPLVVKVADTEKEKNAKRLQTAMASIGSFNNIGLQTAALGLGAAYYQQLLQLQQVTANNSFGLGTGLGDNLTMAAIAQQSGSGVPAGSAFGTTSGTTAGLGNLGSAALSAAVAQANQQKTLGVGGLSNDVIMQAYLGMQQPPPPTQAQSPFIGYAGGAVATQPPVQPQPPQQPQQQLAHNTSSYMYTKQREGPEGSNLFIYHLPNDVLDADLIQMFSPFGNVISAKVFIDKVTNLSKCFGFVSYDTPMEAQSAIQAMNGFQIGTKRLKVQLKRPKDANKPY